MMLTASRRRDGAVVGIIGYELRFCVLAISLDSVFFFKVLLLGPATLPAILPILDEELKAETIDAKTWLEAYTQIAVIHFVLVRERMEKAQMTCNGEEQIIVERR